MTLYMPACNWNFKPRMLAYLWRLASVFSLLYGISMPSCAQIILSAERDSPAVREFATELKQRLPERTVTYMPAVLLKQQPSFAAGTSLILLGPALLDWRLQLSHSHPATLMMQVSRVQAQQRLKQQQPPQLSFLWSDPPIRRQIALLKLMLPGAQNIGVLYSQQSAFLLPEIKQALRAEGLVLYQQFWSDSPDTSSLNHLLSYTDVVLGLDDTQIYNPSSIKSILLSSYARKQALFGPSAAFIKAGSLASSYSDKMDWLSTLQQLLRTPTKSWPQSIYPNAFKVMVNQQVARSLGIQNNHPAALNQDLHQRRLTP